VQGGSVSESGDSADALVAAFYPGELGGEAIAAVLCGEVAPSGRLPVTVYTADWADRRTPTDMELAPHQGPGGSSIPGATYWFADPSADVIFPFGRGLSYTSWALAWSGPENVTIDAEAWAAGSVSPPAFTVAVSNTGAVSSGVSVLGFISSGLPSEPRCKLFDFGRLGAVSPGAPAAPVSVSVPASVAALVNASGSFILTPGLYHEFYAQPGAGMALVGEVSSVNDDATDNRFFKPVGRFPTIEEDVAPLRLLCNEYPG
jgi:hypothetical protein